MPKITRSEPLFFSTISLGQNKYEMAVKWANATSFLLNHRRAPYLIRYSRVLTVEINQHDSTFSPFEVCFQCMFASQHKAQI